MKRYSVEQILKILCYITAIEIFMFSYKDISITYLLLSIFIFVLAFYKDFIKYFKINRTLLNLTTIIFILLIFLRVTLQDIITPALESLIVLLSIKLIEDKERRDYLQIFLISILVFTGATIFSFTISFLFFFLIFIFLINLTIIFLNFFSHDRNLTFKVSEVIKISYKSTLIPLFSIPLMILLFFALPRTQTPIFNFFGSTLTSRSGFSENIKLGNISEIQEDNSIIFRVDMEKIDEENLYWRGTVLEFFENNEWSDVDIEDTNKRYKIEGFTIDQTIYLEPYGGNYLFGLDIPINIFGKENIKRKKDFSFRNKEIIMNKIRYNVKSIITDRFFEENINKTIYLQLPKDLSKKFYELSFSLKRESVFETIENVQNYLKGGEFKYSLTNLTISNKPIEDFLFISKRGNCEYFATSMALILRALNIPSRVVAGYLGGLYNDFGKYYIVRQSDAHLWVEAYIDEIGWIRFDPTPSILRNEALTKKNRISKFSLFIDTINYYYTNLIINYDFEKQISLLNNIRLSFRKPEIRISIDIKKISLVIGITLLTIYLLFLTFSYKKRSFEDKILNYFYRKMRKLGFLKNKNEGLEEFLNKIDDEDIRKSIKNFVYKFEEFYYKDIKIKKDDYIHLKSLL